MKRFIILMFVVCSCVTGNPLTYAEDVKIEEWIGTLKRPGKRLEHVTFKVKRTERRLYFLGIVYLETFFKFREHNTKGEIHTFLWTPGKTDVNCLLHKQEDGSYVGECQFTDSSSRSLKLALRPPQTSE